MSNKVEKIKRFYEKGLYTRAAIDAMFEAGKLTAEEYAYIIGE